MTVACVSIYQSGPNGVYSSTNSGYTWTRNQTLVAAGAIASSADGTKLVATSDGGWLIPNYIMVSPPLAAAAVPSLGITLSGNKTVLSWPTSAASFVLQSTTNLSTGSWGSITNGIYTVGANNVFTNKVSGKASFFHLKQ